MASGLATSKNIGHNPPHFAHGRETKLNNVCREGTVGDHEG